MQYNKDGLEKMALVDLRIIGRAVGVKSPTSLKKSELVTEILLVVNGEKPSLKSKGGRPVVQGWCCQTSHYKNSLKKNKNL